MRPSTPEAALRRDEEAISEVVGYLATFSIISTLILISLLAFNGAQERAEERVMQRRADSIAQRVAVAVVEVALHAERHPTADLEIPLDLPDSLEGHGYVLTLTSTDVTVVGGGVEARQPLFNALSTLGPNPTCDGTGLSHGVQAGGGTVRVGYDGSGAQCVYLEN